MAEALVRRNKKKYVLYLNKEELDKRDLKAIIDIHDQNRLIYEQLQAYYEAQHDILYREKPDDAKNNKLVNNYPGYIVDVAVGYFAGKPVTYSSDNGDFMDAVKKVFDDSNEQDNISVLTKWVLTKKHAFELIYTDEDGAVKVSVDEPENIIMIYDTQIEPEPLFAIRRTKTDELHDISDEESVTVYGRDKNTEYIYKNGDFEFVSETEHFFGGVPVVEYMMNEERRGVFEKQLTLINAYNNTQSDTQNDIEYFADSYLALIGMGATENDDIADMKENRVILLDENGQAYFITKQVNDTYLENHKKRLKEDIHRFSMVPNLTDESFSGNLSGVALKFKLWGLEQVASSLERKFKSSIARRTQLITNILNKSSSYDYRELRQHYTRNIPEHMKEEAEVLGLLLGKVTDETAYAKMSFLDDPQGEKEAMEKQRLERMSAYNLDDSDEDKDEENEDSEENDEV